MYPPAPSGSRSTGPPPSVPAPVRTAVKFMYAGAAVTAAWLITGLALIITGIQTAARGQFLGRGLTSPQARPLVTVWTVFGLAVIARWLPMARFDIRSHGQMTVKRSTAQPPRGWPSRRGSRT